MGIATWSMGKPARIRGSAAPTIIGEYIDGGAHSTSTTASNLTNGAAGAGSAITAVAGDILRIQCDEAARVMFGGETATASVGHILFALETFEVEIPESGTVSIIDVA